MNSTINTPICIIGAGPSGATLSIFLSQKNIEHIIIDAATFPRDKVCGDGLNMKTIRALNLIDRNLVYEEFYEKNTINECWGVRSISKTGKLIDFEFKPQKGNEKMPPYGVSKRYDFDNILAKRIDKNVFYENCKATKLTRVNNKWEIVAKHNGKEILINTAFVIGADGDHSIVLKTVGERKINRNHYAGGVRQYWKGIENIHPKNLLEFYYPKDSPMSYFWIFPLQNGEANVGFGTLSSIAAKHNINIREAFNKIIKEDKNIAPRFKNATCLSEVDGWGLPLASLKRNNVGEGWILLGDAGSLISPISGEGIGTGMLASYVTAQFIERAVKQNDFSLSMFTHYNREVYKRLKDDIRTFNWSMKLSPKFLGWIISSIANLSFLKHFYQKKAEGYWDTAYKKELIVNFD